MPLEDREEALEDVGVAPTTSALEVGRPADVLRDEDSVAQALAHQAGDRRRAVVVRRQLMLHELAEVRYADGVETEVGAAAGQPGERLDVGLRAQALVEVTQGDSIRGTPAL